MPGQLAEATVREVQGLGETRNELRGEDKMKLGVITLGLAFSMALAFLVVAGLPSMSGAGTCPDQDSDTICDPDDNCLTKFNPSQNDTNTDGYGNACDADWDDNGKAGPTDLGLWKVHFPHVNADATDLVIDCDEPPNNGVGPFDLGCWKATFPNPPGPSGKACADPVTPGACP
jgi:hypothetical protein